MARKFKSSSRAARQPLVFVADDDISVRESFEELIRYRGYRVECFEDGHSLLASLFAGTRPHCLVLDISMPGLTGLELQRNAWVVNSKIPILFVSGYADVPTAIQAMKAGAVEVLQKPVAADVLLQAIARAVERHSALLARESEDCELHSRYRRLSPREREVMECIVTGSSNRVVANRLGIAEITVKAHRASVMRKMEADSLAALIHMGLELQIPQRADWAAFSRV